MSSISVLHIVFVSTPLFFGFIIYDRLEIRKRNLYYIRNRMYQEGGTKLVLFQISEKIEAFTNYLPAFVACGLILIYLVELFHMTNSTWDSSSPALPQLRTLGINVAIALIVCTIITIAIWIKVVFSPIVAGLSGSIIIANYILGENGDILPVIAAIYNEILSIGTIGGPPFAVIVNTISIGSVLLMTNRAFSTASIQDAHTAVTNIFYG